MIFDDGWGGDIGVADVVARGCRGGCRVLQWPENARSELLEILCREDTELK